MWVALATALNDKNLGPYDRTRRLGTVPLTHNVASLKTASFMVVDRVNDRSRCFKTDGTFCGKASSRAKTLLAGSASGFSFSPDQRFL